MKTFEAGKSYSCRSICDSGCVFTYTVKSRTAASVVIDVRGTSTRRKIITDASGVEMFFPLGQYSMCPVIRAA